MEWGASMALALEGRSGRCVINVGQNLIGMEPFASGAVEI
jgi:hypothetical protein